MCKEIIEKQLSLILKFVYSSKLAEIVAMMNTSAVSRGALTVALPSPPLVPSPPIFSGENGGSEKMGGDKLKMGGDKAL